MGERVQLNRQEFIYSLYGSFMRFKQNEEMFDVTLACEGDNETTVFIEAHKLILAASSPVLKRLFNDFPGGSGSVVYLDVNGEILSAMIEYFYTGNVKLDLDQVGEFLKAANRFKIDGLMMKDSDFINESERKRKREEATTTNPPKKNSKRKFNPLNPLARFENQANYAKNTSERKRESEKCGEKTLEEEEEDWTYKDNVSELNVGDFPPSQNATEKNGIEAANESNSSLDETERLYSLTKNQLQKFDNKELRGFPPVNPFTEIGKNGHD